MTISKVGWAASVALSMMHAAGRKRILSVWHGPAALMRIEMYAFEAVC
jgi:hypothetical protein